MTFLIEGLSPEPFRHLYGLSDDALGVAGARRVPVTADFGFPDRVEMRDLDVGESALLLNYTHMAADTPYRSSHAIFVLEGADRPYRGVGEVPEVMRRRVLSLRSFDSGDEMIDADLVDGREAETLIDRLLADARASYVHAHYARRGCFAARIDRL